MRGLRAWSAIAVMALGCGSSFAQTFPTKSIRVIVGGAAGTTNDVAARMLGNQMSQTLGQAVVVDNRPGANYTIAANAVVKAPHDGYTVYFGLGQAPHPIFNKNNAVDAAKDLVPISNSISGSFFFYTTAKKPLSTLPELVAYAKANPGKLNFGSSSELNELVMQVFKSKTGITFTSIPYKTSVPVVAAMLAGDIDITNGAVEAYMPHVQTGAIRVLFTAARRRFDALPGVPTAAEFGIPDFEAQYNIGFWAPQGTPRDVIQKLNAAAVAAVKSPEVAEWIRRTTLVAVGSTPEEQLRDHEAEMNFWIQAARQADYQPK